MECGNPDPDPGKRKWWLGPGVAVQVGKVVGFPICCLSADDGFSSGLEGGVRQRQETGCLQHF